MCKTQGDGQFDKTKLFTYLSLVYLVDNYHSEHIIELSENLRSPPPPPLYTYAGSAPAIGMDLIVWIIVWIVVSMDGWMIRFHWMD